MVMPSLLNEGDDGTHQLHRLPLLSFWRHDVRVLLPQLQSGWIEARPTHHSMFSLIRWSDERTSVLTMWSGVLGNDHHFGSHVLLGHVPLGNERLSAGPRLCRRASVSWWARRLYRKSQNVGPHSQGHHLRYARESG